MAVPDDDAWRYDLLSLRTSWQSEAVLISWLGLSLVLTTLAVAFHHMTRVKVLLLNRPVATMLALLLTLLSLGVATAALLGYHVRWPLSAPHMPHESRLHFTMLIFGCLLLLTQALFGAAMFVTTLRPPAR